jgi:hypothetical protein
MERVEGRLVKLEDSVASAAREMREQILDQFREFTAEVQRWKEEMTSAVAKALAEVDPGYVAQPSSEKH